MPGVFGRDAQFCPYCGSHRLKAGASLCADGWRWFCEGCRQWFLVRDLEAKPVLKPVLK